MRCLLLLLAVVSSGCAIRGWNVHLTPKCHDGLPPLVFVDVGCPPDGICGYTCRPGRWDAPEVRTSAPARRGVVG